MSFAPTIFGLLLQQIGLLSLLGLVGFLHFEKQKHNMAAGASLVLVAVKPHLYYLFWFILFLWLLDRRRWKILAGLGSGILLTSAIPMVFDYQVFNEFFTLYLTPHFPRPFDHETPTIARALRHLIDIDNPLPQLLPALFGISWSSWYWKQHKSDWNWLQHLPLLLLISLTTNFFAWSCDQVVLLPALLQGTVWCLNAPARNIAIPVALYAATELAVLLVKFFTPHDFWYFWLSLVWCSIYLYVRKTARAKSFTSAEAINISRSRPPLSRRD